MVPLATKAQQRMHVSNHPKWLWSAYRSHTLPCPRRQRGQSWKIFLKKGFPSDALISSCKIVIINLTQTRRVLTLYSSLASICGKSRLLAKGLNTLLTLYSLSATNVLFCLTRDDFTCHNVGSLGCKVLKCIFWHYIQ